MPEWICKFVSPVTFFCCISPLSALHWPFLTICLLVQGLNMMPSKFCSKWIVWTIGVCLFVCLFYFNWRLITLQYCSGFCHTLTWISHRCTCVPHPEPPSPSHSSGSSEGTGPEHPSSCIEPGLVVRFTYDNIHVSMLFCQIIPPSPLILPTSSALCFSFNID